MAESIGLKGGQISVIALCTLHSPYKIPGLFCPYKIPSLNKNGFVEML